MSQGDYRGASSRFERNLLVGRELGFRRVLAAGIAGIAGMAGVAVGVGRAERATRLLGAAQVLLDSIGVMLDPDDRADNQRSEVAARTELGEEAFARIYAEGQAMSLEQAVEYALEADVEA